MRYRKEIDGLRAIAVISVVFFHANFPWFGGGYVGVDVFFVISGYLIGTIIFQEYEAGEFSLKYFYERRARRILPALFLVMIVTVPISWLILLPGDLKSYSQSLISVVGFVSNIHFWFDSGYWQETNELKPLLHTWSLAVEEQYYILFPLFIGVLWRLGKRTTYTALLIVAMLSLFLAEWGAYNAPTSTFFLLPTRFWEIAVGALISVYLICSVNALKGSNLFIDVIGVVGLLMILYAVTVFDKATPFPSYYTLLPVIGSAIVLVFASQKTIVGRLLSNGVLVFFGLISYSLYLWHQPLFAFFRYYSLTELSEGDYLILILLSVVLAYFSWRFVENPFRRREVLASNKRFVIGMLLVSVILIVFGIAGQYDNNFMNKVKLEKTILEDVSYNKVRAHCDVDYGREFHGKKICLLGRGADANIHFAVFGDSHAETFLPMFEIVAKTLGVSYVHSGLGGCPPLVGVDVMKGNFNEGVCKKHSLRQLEFIKENNIDTVFLIARWSFYTNGDYGSKMDEYFLINDKRDMSETGSRSVFESGIKETVLDYQKLGVDVYILEQIPQQKMNSKKLYMELAGYSKLTDADINKKISSFSVLREESDDLQSYNRSVLRRLGKETGATVINVDDYFCDEKRCRIGSSEHSNYRDDNHVSIYGAELLVPEFIGYLQ